MLVRLGFFRRISPRLHWNDKLEQCKLTGAVQFQRFNEPSSVRCFFPDKFFRPARVDVLEVKRYAHVMKQNYYYFLLDG